MALSFIVNAAFIFVPLAIEASNRAKAAQDAISTNVQIIVGSGEDDLGGMMPHVALWDDNGNRIGQYHPGKKEKVAAGQTHQIAVLHTQTVPEHSPADPYYIMLSNPDSDAICIASITVANNKISGGFYGDTGFTCGQSWYLSNNKIGPTFATPKCVWLDGDHTNGINAQALSFHMNDLAPQKDKMDEYTNNLDTLCKSTPRFSYWGNLEPNSIPPFFNPPLKYNPDSQGGEGADIDPQAIIDKIVYDKGRYKRSTRRSRLERRVKGSNHNPSHLVVTDNPSHSAKELCNHPNSYGWDTVSTEEGLYCDMEHKQLYPLCSATVLDNCFDMVKKELSSSGSKARDGILLTQKQYNTSSHWRL